jgi:hypothetical protein
MVLSTLLLYVAVYAIVFSMGIYYINRLIAKGPIVGEDGAIKKGRTEPSHERGFGRLAMISFERTVPVLRMFSLEKAKEFYLDFLGFKIDWEHRFEEDAPVYMQVSRSNAVLHLSEHFGDGTPGAAAYFYMKGIEEFHRELSEKNYRHARPGIHRQTGA